MLFHKTLHLFLVPKTEDGKIASADDTRPIQQGSIWSKVADHLVLTMLPMLDKKVQYAMQAGGATHCATLLQSSYHKGVGLLSLDASNAFDLTKRKVLLRKLNEDGRFLHVLPYLRMRLGTPYEAYLTVDGEFQRTHTISEGLMQGGVLSTYFFCYINQSFLLNALDAANAAGGPPAVLASFSDDVSVVGLPQQLASAELSLRDMKETGYTLNTSKTRVAAFPDAEPQLKAELQAFATSRSFTYTEDAFKVVGVPLGGTPEQRQALITKKFGKIFSRGRRILSSDIDLPSQSAYLLYKLCVIPMTMHMMRCCNFVDLRLARGTDSDQGSVLEQFDVMSETLLEKITNIRASNWSWVTHTLYRLPNRHGGGGIPSASKVHPIAFYSAFAEACVAIGPLLDTEPTNLMSAYKGSVHLALLAFREFMPASVLMELPQTTCEADVLSLWTHESPNNKLMVEYHKNQHEYSEHAVLQQTKTIEFHTDGCDPFPIDCMTSYSDWEFAVSRAHVQTSGALGVLSTIPRSKYTTLSNGVFSMLFSTILFLPTYRLPVSRNCPLCTKPVNPTHFSSCLGINLSRCQAHDSAQRTFLMRHGDAYDEPFPPGVTLRSCRDRGLNDEAIKALRLDLLAKSSEGANHYTDITIPEPRSSSYIADEYKHCIATTGGPRGTLANSVARKKTKYGVFFPQGRDVTDKFLVLAVSSLGAIHKEGTRFIKATLGPKVGARYTQDLSCIVWNRMYAAYQEYRSRCSNLFVG